MKINKASVIYFSPTGTTARAAMALAEGTGLGFENIDLTTLQSRKSFNHNFHNNELAIVGLPVYGGRLPQNIDDFFRGLKGHETPAVALVVYGNREYEDALLELKLRLEKCGFIVIAAAAFIGEHTFSRNIATGRPDAGDIATARTFGAQIARVAGNNLKGRLTIKGNYPFVAEGFDPAKPRALTSYAIISTNNCCVSCGLCAENCPWQAIDRKDYHIIDSARCMLCFRCIKYCPTHAKAVREDKYFELLAQFEMRLNARRKEPELFSGE
jgi:ferredoxin